VDRRFGWDCHGLPAEVEAERLLGISGKADILAMGIETFNEACRDSVLRYTKEWEEYVTRQARWVDFETTTRRSTSLHGERHVGVQAVARQGPDLPGLQGAALLLAVRDPAVQPRAADGRRRLHRPDGPVRHRAVQAGDGAWILAWTTTPWTLPSNLAVAVGPDITYVTVEAENGERYVLAENRLPAYEKEFGGARKLNSFRGQDLLGRRYQPLFDYLTDTDTFGTQNAWRVIPSDEVTTEDGTGVVHMAPAYGEADAAACLAAASRSC